MRFQCLAGAGWLSIPMTLWHMGLATAAVKMVASSMWMAMLQIYTQHTGLLTDIWTSCPQATEMLPLQFTGCTGETLVSHV